MKKVSIFFICLSCFIGSQAQKNSVLEPNDFAHYPEYFNSVDDAPIKTLISNSDSWNWMQENIPWFECPDEEIEEIYYFRWWVFRKHIKKTPSGYVITEFLPEVKHAKKYNTMPRHPDFMLTKANG